VGTAKSVIAKVRQAVELWPSFAEKAGLSLPLSDDIKAQLLYF
jgi:hypothetical protein